MSEYEEWFEKMRRHSPGLQVTPPKLTITFWENMYQAFKARLVNEVVVYSSGLLEPASLTDTADGDGPVDFEEYEPGWDDPRDRCLMPPEEYDRGKTTFSPYEARFLISLYSGFGPSNSDNPLVTKTLEEFREKALVIDTVNSKFPRGYALTRKGYRLVHGWLNGKI